MEQMTFQEYLIDGQLDIAIITEDNVARLLNKDSIKMEMIFNNEGFVIGKEYKELEVLKEDYEDIKALENKK